MNPTSGLAFASQEVAEQMYDALRREYAATLARVSELNTEHVDSMRLSAIIGDASLRLHLGRFTDV